jgi:hypothetical protein
MATVKEVVDQLYAGTMTVDKAEKALQGVQGTRRPPLTPEQQELGDDVEAGDENDVSQLSVLTLAGKISDDDAARLMQALTPPPQQ